MEIDKDKLKNFLNSVKDKTNITAQELIEKDFYLNILLSKLNFEEYVFKGGTCLAKAYLENPERIKKIAKNIAEHFKENLDGKFKAMIVAVNRKACIYYKRELDKLLPPEYSEVVISFNQGDSAELVSYYKELQERYPKKDSGEIIKEITTNFKEETTPKILIVTDMLLTGFDAPILQTMYLDKRQ